MYGILLVAIIVKPKPCSTCWTHKTCDEILTRLDVCVTFTLVLKSAKTTLCT